MPLGCSIGGRYVPMKDLQGLVRLFDVAGRAGMRPDRQYGYSNAEVTSNAARARAMNARTLSGSLRPGAASTPEATSTPHGFSSAMASATFSGLRPPAAIRCAPPLPNI